jgi:hypothetical protein
MGGLDMDSQDFTARMQAQSDEELGEIVIFGERDGFLPSAIAAARKELIARNLSPTFIREIAESIKTKRDKDTELAGRPLSWPARIAFLVFSISLVPIIVAVALQIKGYKQKSSDAWKWMGLGVAFWVGLYILTAVSRIMK